jgi:hypothetical protein
MVKAFRDAGTAGPLGGVGAVDDDRDSSGRSLSGSEGGRQDGLVALTPCPDLWAASWLVDSNVSWARLVAFGPACFAAYARLRYIPDPAFEGQSENDASRACGAPSDTDQLRTLLDVLAAFTGTADRCYFCLWDGWGTDIHGEEGGPITNPWTGRAHCRQRIEPAFPPSVLNGPKVVIPHRAYYLFHGPLADFGDWGAAEMWPGQPRPGMPDPAYIWPDDHAWCVANDVDPHWAGIGADTAAIEHLLADPGLDVVPSDPDQEPPRYV